MYFIIWKRQAAHEEYIGANENGKIDNLGQLIWASTFFRKTLIAVKNVLRFKIDEKGHFIIQLQLEVAFPPTKLLIPFNFIDFLADSICGARARDTLSNWP